MKKGDAIKAGSAAAPSPRSRQPGWAGAGVDVFKNLHYCWGVGFFFPFFFFFNTINTVCKNIYNLCSQPEPSGAASSLGKTEGSSKAGRDAAGAKARLARGCPLAPGILPDTTSPAFGICTGLSGAAGPPEEPVLGGGLKAVGRNAPSSSSGLEKPLPARGCGDDKPGGHGAAQNAPACSPRHKTHLPVRYSSLFPRVSPASGVTGGQGSVCAAVGTLR